MAANQHDAEEEFSMKRPREQSPGDSEELPKKRRKKEKVAISIQTYFSLRSQDVINEAQVAIWDDFITTLKKFIFPQDIYIDDSSPRVIYVPQKTLAILQKINYNEISLDDLEAILEEKQNRFIEVLHKIKHSRKSTKQERENLFAQLKQFIEEGIINLTLTSKKTGWNILHAIIGFGRVDLLICIQQYLLPELREQYKKLLGAKTSRRQKTPGAMTAAPYYEETSSLLSEEPLSLLKNKQLIVALGMTVSHKEELQCVTLYEQLKNLIAEGADPTVTEDTRGLTVLHLAACKREVELVRHIFQHASLRQCEILLNAKTKRTQSTAAAIAEYDNNEEIICLLKEKEGQIEIFNGLKKLQTITETNRLLLYERIEQFIKNDGDPTLTDDRGLNILHYGACFYDIKLVLIVKECAAQHQYTELLCAKSRNLGETPYDVVLNHKKKGSKRDEMLKLLDPNVAQNISQPSQQSYGKALFFSSPTLLSEGDKLEPSQAISSPAMQRSP